MNEHYVQGFIQKCAEAGVDLEQLVKVAARWDQVGRLLHAGMTHTADPLIKQRLDRVLEMLNLLHAYRPAQIVGARGGGRPLSGHPEFVEGLLSLRNAIPKDVMAGERRAGGILERKKLKGF
jgi:hypothetical protein